MREVGREGGNEGGKARGRREEGRRECLCLLQCNTILMHTFWCICA